MMNVFLSLMIVAGAYKSLPMSYVTSMADAYC